MCWTGVKRGVCQNYQECCVGSMYHNFRHVNKQIAFLGFFTCDVRKSCTPEVRIAVQYMEWSMLRLDSWRCMYDFHRLKLLYLMEDWPEHFEASAIAMINDLQISIWMLHCFLKMKDKFHWIHWKKRLIKSKNRAPPYTHKTNYVYIKWAHRTLSTSTSVLPAQMQSSEHEAEV